MNEAANDDAPRSRDLQREQRAPRAPRLLLWAALSAAFVAFLAVSRINTYLGVQVTSRFDDKRGHEYVWRVWWRARHNVIHIGPSWGFSLLLFVLIALFLAGCVLALWVALVPDDPGVRTTEPDLDPIELR